MTMRGPRITAAVLLVAALLALVPFVQRGWIPHDEGMIGQTAERVLVGQRPHVDFDEPYTGALSHVYALTFRLLGVDLLHVRWVLFGVASASLLLIYRLARRDLSPVGAACGTWAALLWSFPHYFAGVPSWWVLGCALVAVWALLRHIDTGMLRFAVVAGLAVGVAVAIKQTGIYLVMAVGLVLLYRGGTMLSPQAWRSGAGLLRAAVASAALIAVLVLLSPRLGVSEVLYLLLPVAAAAMPLLLTRPSGDENSWRAVLPAVAAAVAAGLPLLLLMLPYVAEGQATDFLRSAFIAPGERLRFASWPLPSPWVFAVGLALSAVLVPCGFDGTAERARRLTVARWTVVMALLVLALVAEKLAAWFMFLETMRTAAALVPVATAVWLLRQREGADRADDHRRRVVVPVMLACAALVQFPYAYFLYFCYVMPLVVLAVAPMMARAGGAGAPLLALVIGFGVIGLTREQVRLPQALPLALPRASLVVRADQARTYGAVLAHVRAHLPSGGRLVATPDCPELYFLADRFSPHGEIFEFLRWPHPRHDLPQIWSTADVVVINHAPDFSPRVPAEALASLSVTHRGVARIDGFEVRWRQ